VGENFFFEPTPGFYGYIAQGKPEALNDAIRILADHIESPSVPFIKDWTGPADPLISVDYNWESDDNDPPGLIKYYRSRIQINITNKHSPLILEAILAHELTHHYLTKARIETFYK
jgi:hypothetical protein